MQMERAVTCAVCVATFRVTHDTQSYAITQPEVRSQERQVSLQMLGNIVSTSVVMPAEQLHAGRFHQA